MEALLLSHLTEEKTESQRSEHGPKATGWLRSIAVVSLSSLKGADQGQPSSCHSDSPPERREERGEGRRRRLEAVRCVLSSQQILPALKSTPVKGPLSSTQA